MFGAQYFFIRHLKPPLKTPLVLIMDILLYFGLFIISLAVLLKASDWFVAAAERIGLSLGISPFIIGVTIVAFGTSLPELASSIAAVFIGESEIVIGNVVGSNITNIALVLGAVAIVGRKINIEKDIMSIDMPLLMASGFLLWFIVSDQNVRWFDAILLLGALLIFLVYSFKEDEGNGEQERSPISWKSYGLLFLSGVLVYFGAEYTIKAIANLSGLFGISSEVIALSLVALGTSLPELVVSVSAARKGSTEIAVGNILGSNIFNTYAVMGIPALFGTLVIPDNVLAFSLPLMVALTVLFAIMCLSRTISRWEGWMLFLIYCFFVAELFKGVI